MAPERKELLQERCDAFKSIQRSNKLYTVLQFVLDFIFLGSMVLMLVVSRFLFPILIIGVIILKLALVFFLGGSKGNLVGLVITLTYIPLLAYFEMLDESVGLSVLILMAHLFRIIPSIAVRRISGLYGAPGFKGSILANELEKDEKLMSTVLGRYNDVSQDMLVSTAIKEAALPRATEISRFVGSLLLVCGLCLMIGVSNSKADMSGTELTIGEKTSGKTLSLVTDKIYRQHGSGSNDSYWCRVGEQAVSVNVYDSESKDKFYKLCVYWKASTEVETAWLSGNNVGEGSGEPVSFTAEVKPYTKYTAFKPVKQFEDYIDDDIDIVREYYLDVVNPRKTQHQSGVGIVLAIVGVALLGVYYTMFFTSRYNITML